MNKSAFVILVLCCLALVNAVDFQNQQLTLILNGAYTKLFWKYDVDVVEIESHSNHRRNLGNIVSFYSDVELSTYVTMLNNEQFKFVEITVSCSREIPNYLLYRITTSEESRLECGGTPAPHKKPQARRIP